MTHIAWECFLSYNGMSSLLANGHVRRSMRAPLNNPDNESIFDRELTPHELAGIKRKKELANFIFSDLVD